MRPGAHRHLWSGAFSLVLGAVLAVTLAFAPAHAEEVALTFDDLPTLSLTSALDYAQTTTQRLLTGLKRDRLPATGFVNEIQLEGPDRTARIALLNAWLDAGMDLGNHTYSHLSFTSTPVDAYIADTLKGEQITRGLLAARGREPRWFRHPYLETGPTPEIRQTFETWLAAHGYRVAPVTMENADWMFSPSYDDAVLRQDQAEAVRIRRLYLDYTAKVVPWYRQAGLDVLGRRPAFVFLMHASRLNADSIHDLAKILKDNDLTPATLDRAMADPAYQTPDTTTGPGGNQWLTRWAQTLQKPMPWASYPPPPPELAAANQRLGATP